MTEPTIINDVDVSGCEFYNSSAFFCWAYPDEICRYNTNCHYKQLKRKEQELNEIKEDIKAGIFCVTCKKENENDKLRAECEQLKERATIAEDNFAKEIQARLYHQTEWLKFSKCLDEIKEFLIKIYGTSENNVYISQSFKLITKINEVKNEQ